MRINQFESDDARDRRDTPWRKHAPPVNKTPSNPDYPTQPFNYDEWMKNSKPMEEEVNGIPEIGDVIRTKKMQMEGKVERLGKNRAGYDEVFFRVWDGRLMVTPLSNVTVIEKLADEEMDVMEEIIDEVSTELLAKYKTAAGKSASEADKRGDYATGNKRFSGIVQATKKQFSNDSKKQVSEITKPGLEDNFTIDDIKRLETISDLPTLKARAKELIKGKADRRMKPEKISWFYNAIDGMVRPMAIIKLMYDLLLSGEGNSVVGTRNSMRQNSYRARFGEQKAEEGTMGGINRSAPSNDVSYEHVLDEVKAMWEKSQLNELSIEKLKAYKDAATSVNVAKHAPLRKVAKHMKGAGVANQKIKTKTGDKVGMHQPDRGTYEEVDSVYEDLRKEFGDILGQQHKEVQAAKKTDIKKVPSKNPHYFIQYRTPTNDLSPIKWQVRPVSDVDAIKHEGNSSNEKEAYQDAEAFIDSIGNSAEASRNVTINFNAAFAREISPDGQPIYMTLWEGPIFVYSMEPQEGYKKTVIRTPEHSRTAGAALLPVMTISPKEANAVKLHPGNRYTMGPREELEPGIYGYTLIKHSPVEPGDRVVLKEPSITVS